MKALKLLGLAAIAAVAAMAFLGASSAMAESTALCKEDVSPCPAGRLISSVHEVTLIGHLIVLHTSLKTVECDVLFAGTVQAPLLGASLAIVGGFIYTNCTTGCTVEEASGSATVSIEKTAAETGKVIYEYEVHPICSGLNCTYNSEGLVGTARGPLLSVETNGEIKIVNQTLHKVSGLFCPTTSELTITTTPLEPTYITS